VLHYSISTIATIATIVSPVMIGPATAQIRYQGTLSAGHACMVDVDDLNPSGSYSVTAALERRQAGAAISVGVEGGLHEYLTLRQNLPPDVGLNLGVALELLPIRVPVGLTLGFRSHAVMSAGDWFNTGEAGVVYRW
jgi:hypothetical protein